MAHTPTHRPNEFRLTDEENREISESEIEQLRLRIRILGVRYTRFDDQPGVQVLFEATFVLPEGRYLKYARLPFQGIPLKGNAADLPIEAMTPEGEQLARVGVYDAKDRRVIDPQLGGGSGPANFSVKGFEKTKEYDTRDIPHNIFLKGFKSVWNERSHWEFNNLLPNGEEFRDYYPTHIRLIASFATHRDSNSEIFPFYLRFSSDCQVSLMDYVRKELRHFIGKPRQYQIYIGTPYEAKVVEEHLSGEKCGLYAALEGRKEWVRPQGQQVFDTSGAEGHNDGSTGSIGAEK